MDHPALELARGFADELTEAIRGIFPDSPGLEVRQRRDRVVLGLFKPNDDHDDFPLRIGGEVVARWRLVMAMDLDSAREHLKVMRSNLTLFANVDRTPLVRYEFDDAMHTAPVAHWQFHGERGAFSHLLGQALAAGATVAPHSLSSLHFPVGGGRMRPGVDDWLEFLVRECHFDAATGWESVLLENRRRYRSIQAQTIVRDMQEVAADSLRRLGWAVEPPPGGAPPANEKYLSRW